MNKTEKSGLAMQDYAELGIKCATGPAGSGRTLLMHRLIGSTSEICLSAYKISVLVQIFIFICNNILKVDDIIILVI